MAISRVEKTRVDAARRYAKSHGMTVHEAMKSHNFQFAWNKFQENPSDQTFRSALGIRRKRDLTKEAEYEDRMFCKHETVWRDAIVDGEYFLSFHCPKCKKIFIYRKVERDV